MATKYKNRKEKRYRRHNRIRRKISGNAERPRLCVSLSNKHMYVQVIDDEKGHTVVAVSSQGKEFSDLNKSANVEGAAALGKIVGAKILEAGIAELVFDRGGYKYHGKIKAIADAVREAGLKL